jgi:hypothetical protein
VPDAVAQLPAFDRDCLNNTAIAQKFLQAVTLAAIGRRQRSFERDSEAEASIAQEFQV